MQRKNSKKASIGSVSLPGITIGEKRTTQNPKRPPAKKTKVGSSSLREKSALMDKEKESEPEDVSLLARVGHSIIG